MKPEQFGKVCHTAKKAVIVGSGPSLKDCSWRIPEDVIIIAINGAIDIVPRADFWFTLDPSVLNRKRMRYQREGTVYYAAVPDDYGEKTAAAETHRSPAEPNVIYLRRLMGHIHRPLRLRWGLSDQQGAVHTGNSVWGGLQVACLMGVKSAALLGVDGTGGYVYGNGRPRSLEHLPKLFESGVTDLETRGIKVVVGNLNSIVTCFPRMTPNEALEWLANEKIR